MNFVSWINKLVMDMAGPQCLVKRRDGHQVLLVYHQLLQQNYTYIEAKLGDLLDWRWQCKQASLSAGTYLSVIGGEKGQCCFVHKQLGPFI